MTKVFSVGDTVFAKVRGYPAWPARVDKIVSGPSNKKDSAFIDVFSEEVATFRKRTESFSAEKVCALTVEPLSTRSHLPNRELESQPEPEAPEVQNPDQVPETQEQPRAEMSITLPFVTIKSEPLDMDEHPNDDSCSSSFPVNGKTLEVGKSEPKTEMCKDEDKDGNDELSQSPLKVESGLTCPV